MTGTDRLARYRQKRDFGRTEEPRGGGYALTRMRPRDGKSPGWLLVKAREAAPGR